MTKIRRNSELNGRNAEIANALDGGLYPLLPFEIEEVARAFKAAVSRQDELGDELGKAMEQGAETFHDNAPADAVNSDSRTNAAYGKLMQSILDRAVVFPFPESAEAVTLGSVVGMQYQGDDEAVYSLITGRSADVPELVADTLKLPNEVKIEDGITVNSAIGRAAFNAAKGDLLEVSIGSAGRKIKVKVVDIL